MVSELMEPTDKAGSVPLLDSLSMVVLRKRCKGRVLLLGDSARCITLMSDQGAGMAITSAEILANELQSECGRSAGPR